MIPRFGRKEVDRSAKRAAESESALETTQAGAAQSPECFRIRHILPLFNANVWLVESGSSVGREVHCLAAEHGKG